MLEENDLNGMETARRLRCLSKRIPIIFTTSELGFALEGYEVHPLDYLLKPVEPDKLAWCLQEIREHLAVPSCITIPVTSGQGAAPVNRPAFTGRYRLRRKIRSLSAGALHERRHPHPHVFFRSACFAAKIRKFLFKQQNTSGEFFPGSGDL